MYEIRISPEHDFILKHFLCKALQPVNHPTVQYIPYDIQGTINRDIYKTIIKK